MSRLLVWNAHGDAQVDCFLVVRDINKRIQENIRCVTCLESLVHVSQSMVLPGGRELAYVSCETYGDASALICFGCGVQSPQHAGGEIVSWATNSPPTASSAFIFLLHCHHSAHSNGNTNLLGQI